MHQGNGTHAIFADDERVFTFSMHGGRNYPFHKVPGRWTSSSPTARATTTISTSSPARSRESSPRRRPDLVVYIAGADPHERDRLGRLALTFDGLARRDALVLEQCREVGLPVAIVIGGGYADPIDVHRAGACGYGEDCCRGLARAVRARTVGTDLNTNNTNGTNSTND